MIEPEEESGGERDGRQECVSASIVSTVDAPPIFKACEEVLDLVALSIELGVVALLDAMLGMGRDTRHDAAFFESLTESYGTIGAVGEQVTGGRQILSHDEGGRVIARLSLGKTQKQGASLAVAHDMQLAGQAASATSDTSG